jgi:hypothetical protein
MRKNILSSAVLLFCLLLWPPFYFSQQDEGRGSMAVGPLGAITIPQKPSRSLRRLQRYFRKKQQFAACCKPT